MDKTVTDEKYFKLLKQKYKSEGLSTLNDTEILELALLYAMPMSDVRNTASKLIARFGTLCCVLERSPLALHKLENISEQAAIFLNMQSALLRRCRMQKNINAIFSEETKEEIIRAHFIGQTAEHFYMIPIDAQNRVNKSICLATGTLSRAGVYIREIIETLLRTGAKKVLFAHNHPNGSSMPSEEDILLTYNLNDALELIGVYMLDHVVVTDSSIVGMRSDMKIFDRRNKNYIAPLKY